MKRNLGSILVLLLVFLHTSLYAYEWSTFISKKEAFVNENIYLKYTCKYEDRGELYTIDFNPIIDTQKYELTLLNKSDTFLDGKKTTTYEYIAKVKKVGQIVFDLSVTMKKTSMESIVYGSGSRDDDRGDDSFIRESVHLEKQKLNVKKAPALILGNFTINVKEDDKNVKAYEPYHLDVNISGEGNFENIQPIEYKIDGVKIFSQKPILEVIPTSEGYKGQWTQKFAFVGNKDFTIPAVTMEYYDSTLKRLDIHKIDVKVEQAYTKEELLDAKKDTWEFDSKYMYYFLCFIAGFLVAKIKFKKKSQDSKEDAFINKVKSVNSINELNVLLILTDRLKYENIVSSQKNTTLQQKKKEVLKML